jgi:hypothetical protein
MLQGLQGPSPGKPHKCGNGHSKENGGRHTVAMLQCWVVPAAVDRCHSILRRAFPAVARCCPEKGGNNPRHAPAPDTTCGVELKRGLRLQVAVLGCQGAPRGWADTTHVLNCTDAPSCGVLQAELQAGGTNPPSWQEGG